MAHRIQLKFDRFSGFINEYVANVSPGGIFIRTKSPHAPGEQLEFEFRLGDGFELIRGHGEVVWVRPTDEGPGRPPGMGVRFLELSPGSKDLIYRIVDDYILQGGTPFDLTKQRPASAAPPSGAGEAPSPPSSPRASAPPAPSALPSPPALPSDPAANATVQLPRGAREQAPSPGGPLEGRRLATGPSNAGAAGQPGMPPFLVGDAPPPERAVRVPVVPRQPADSFPSPPGATPATPGPAAPGGSAAASAPAGLSSTVASAGAPGPAGSVASARPVGQTSLPPPLPARPAPAPGEKEHLSSVNGTEWKLALPDLTAARSTSPEAVDPLQQAVASLPPLDDLDPQPAAPVPAPAFAALQPATRKRSSPLLWLFAVALVVLAGIVYLVRDSLIGWAHIGDEGPPEPPAATSRSQSPSPRAPGSPNAPGASTAPASPTSNAAAGSAAAVPGAVKPQPQTAAGAGTRLSSRSASASGLTSGGANPAPQPAGAASTGAASPAGRLAHQSGATPGQPSSSPPGSPAVPSSATSPVGGTAGTSGASGPAPEVSVPASPGAAGPTMVQKITWERSAEGTVVILWGNGPFRPDSFTHARLVGPLREVFRLSGIERPFPNQRLQVGTSELAQIRIGFHQEGGTHQLHVVLDLAGPDVQVGAVEPSGSQLRIHLHSR